MDTTSNAAAGTAPAAQPDTPAAAPAPAVTTPPTSSRPDAKSVMASLTPEQRLLVATGKADQVVLTPEQTAALPPKTPKAEVPAATEQQAAALSAEPAAEPNAEPATPAPEGTAPDAGEETGEAGKPRRFRFASEEDQAVAQLAKSKGISLVEAARLYAGEAKQQPQAAAAEPKVEASTPPADQHVTDIDSKVSANKAKIEELTKERARAADELDNAKMLSLSDEIADLKADNRILDAEKQGHLRNIENQRRSGWDAKVGESHNRALSQYPALAKDGGMEAMAMEAYVQRAINDPQRKALFQSPDWPERLAKEFCERNGIKAVGTAPAAPVAPAAPTAKTQQATMPRNQPQQVTTVTGAKLLTGSDGKSSGSRTITRDEALAAIRSDPQARKAIREHLFKKN